MQRKVKSIVCLWWHVCREKPIRLVIVRDPAGRQKDDYFFCTDATCSEQEIVQRATDRWGVEEAIREAKQCLGFENTRGWCSRTVNRQAPLAMVSTDDGPGHAHEGLVRSRRGNDPTLASQSHSLALGKIPPHLPRHARGLATCPLASSNLIQLHFSSNSTCPRQVHKFLRFVNYALCEAA